MVMMAEALLHYFPWRMLLKGRELPRIAAYTLGICGLMIPFSAWLWERGEFYIVQILWMVIIVGGLIVLALYGLDYWLNMERDLREAEEREQLHQRSRNVKK